MSSTYINGYVKDQPLRNMTSDEVLFWFNKVGREFGKRPMKHNGKEMLTRGKKSIQGQWHETMWNQYPKHLMEPKITIPVIEHEPVPEKEINHNKTRPHRYTQIAKKQYVFDEKIYWTVWFACLLFKVITI